MFLDGFQVSLYLLILLSASLTDCTNREYEWSFKILCAIGICCVSVV